MSRNGPARQIPDGSQSPSPLSFSLNPAWTTQARRMSASLPCKAPHGSRRSTCGTLPRCGVLTTAMICRGTGHHPGTHSASQVILGLRLHRHVARRVSHLRALLPCARGSPPPQFPAPNLGGQISGRRNQKLDLTHGQDAFTVRHRLDASSLASPHGPFMVELFAAWISQDAEAYLGSGRSALPQPNSPRQPRLRAPEYPSGSSSPGRDLHPL